MDINASIFCFYCGRKTTLIYKDIRKSFNGKLITIRNVPLFFCKDCREIFFPDFVVDVFNDFAKTNITSSSYDFKTISNSLKNQQD